MRETVAPPGSVVEFKDGKWVVEPAEAGQLATAGQLQAGGLAQGIGDFQIAGVELGEAVVGLLIAGVVDIGISFVIPFLPTVGGIPSNVIRGLILFGFAALFQMPQIKGPLGASAANAVSFILAVDSVTAFFDIRGLIGGFVAGGLGKHGGTRGRMSALAAGDVQANRNLNQFANPEISRVSSIGV